MSCLSNAYILRMPWPVGLVYFLDLFGLNLFEATVFRRYGFLAAIAVRVAFYVIWHVIYIATINTCTRLILSNIPGLSRDEGNLLPVAVYGLVAMFIVALTKGRLAAPSRNHILHSTRTDVGKV